MQIVTNLEIVIAYPEKLRELGRVSNVPINLWVTALSEYQKNRAYYRDYLLEAETRDNSEGEE